MRPLNHYILLGLRIFEDDSKVLSVSSYLTDVRCLVTRLAISVIVMTATVMLFSSGPELNRQTSLLVQDAEDEPGVNDC